MDLHRGGWPRRGSIANLARRKVSSSQFRPRELLRVPSDGYIKLKYQKHPVPGWRWVTALEATGTSGAQ